MSTSTSTVNSNNSHNSHSHTDPYRVETPLDRVLQAADITLRTLFGAVQAERPYPAGPQLASASDKNLTDSEKSLSASLMRVNHAGEVCAQALYTAQALSTQDPALRAHFEHAAQEETDHLAWTEQRLKELGSRPSWLNPLWYSGAFALGLAAGRFGDRLSLGFVVETEKQVEAHLAEHEHRLPVQDERSRAVVAQMKADEIRHGQGAHAAGAKDLPLLIQSCMRQAAKVMTRIAHHV